MRKIPAAILCLLLSACMPLGNNMLAERMMTADEARAECRATAHSPLVQLGIDPGYIKIMPHRWRYQDRYRIGEYFSRSTMIWTTDHPEPLRHEAIHRGLALAGFDQDFNTHSGMFRDDEHSLVYYTLDRDFPGLQAHRIHPELRRRAKARWETAEYQARLREIETKAAATDSWCKRNT
jgi:hypothetical protein